MLALGANSALLRIESTEPLSLEEDAAHYRNLASQALALVG
jgi:hypothetical protein